MLVYQSPYTNYSDRNGTECRIMQTCDPAEYDFVCVGIMFDIIFDDGFKISAYPEELTKDGVRYDKTPEIIPECSRVWKQVEEPCPYLTECVENMEKVYV